ncbi:MAG: hypothetical protein JNN08_18865 [Bryobacterales bacterium]|nr:hypothetical protein [Bryobacterales bacterium]
MSAARQTTVVITSAPFFKIESRATATSGAKVVTNGRRGPGAYASGSARKSNALNSELVGDAV